MSHWSPPPVSFHFGLMGPGDAHFAQLSFQNEYHLYRPKILLSQNKFAKLLLPYLPIFIELGLH